MKPFLWNLESHNRMPLKKEIEHRKVIHSTDEPFHPQIIKNQFHTEYHYIQGILKCGNSIWTLPE